MRKFLFIVTLLLSLSSYAQTKKTQPATNSKTAYTEKQAMQYMRDYYDFYKSDKKYRVLDARKVSSNVFHVKVEEAYTSDPYSNLYFSRVYVLTILPDGKYKVEYHNGLL
ncbi:hypothetical protein [Capnocytophaga sputigena]|uniref:hypothetical protein n=1 Tax=Capnocytophaga sputigena TaxID=1019 RepID=UPI000BB59BD3|nr:hypothetical protein [Capnocytophaga sputigena]PBN47166.1 hypothetical protein CDC50_00785 [Capnocytophaga sputigena]